MGGCDVAGAMSFMACLYCRCSYVYSLIFIFTEVSSRHAREEG